MERLNKYLAQCVGCSRREADRFIAEGRVCVDGIVAQPGMQVSGEEEITFDKQPAGGKEEKAVIAFYKPVGVTCSEKDAHAKKLVTDCFPFPVRLTYAGRLDRDSEGLLVMTNDGQLIHEMMRGAAGHEKEYIVKTDQAINRDFMKKMAAGIHLKELAVTTRPCKVKQIDDHTFGIILTQGLNRQIRRMAAELGYEVQSIKRIRVMNIDLGSLTPGEYRVLKEDERKELYHRCGL